ncbi:MAG: NAD(P)/FAD-dependent oxidoreductase [Bryobacteraceae bacterium]
MHTCDVLIVGGGPAGSSCAWALRHSGLDVAILDKASFPRDKVCGGWITPGVLSALEIQPEDYARQSVLQPITAFRVGTIHGRAVETAYGRPVSFGILRRQFDDYLLRRSGARILPPMSLVKLEFSQNRWIANDQIEARVLVGAGGHFCPVAQLTEAKAGHESAVVAQEIEFEMSAAQQAGCQVREEIPELYFCADMQGYGWCFRKRNILNIGLGRADPHHLPAHVMDFERFLRSSLRLSFDVPSLRGHAYLLCGTSTRNLVGEGFLLVGDAAGLAAPYSGEGIRPAIESGLLAAKTIEEANGQYSRLQLESYRARLLGQRQSRWRSWTTNLGRYVPSRSIAPLARFLLGTHWFVRDVVLKQWFLEPGASSF